MEPDNTRSVYGGAPIDLLSQVIVSVLLLNACSQIDLVRYWLVVDVVCLVTLLSWMDQTVFLFIGFVLLSY